MYVFMVDNVGFRCVIGCMLEKPFKLLLSNKKNPNYFKYIFISCTNLGYAWTTNMYYIWGYLAYPSNVFIILKWNEWLVGQEVAYLEKGVFKG